ncbi:MAG TPA: peptidylprolyl isomerase [Tangfeifania sp.]|nr:peptidylprolyl isomerase [Tangfeifania sp.]
MNKIKNILLFLFFAAFLVSCQSSKSEKEKRPEQTKTATQQIKETGWEDVMPSIVELDSYDDNRILESGQGFFVEDDLVVTKYSLISQANKVMISPFDTDKKFVTDKYVAFDRISDLIILKIDSVKRKPIELFPGNAPNGAKTSYIREPAGQTLQIFTGKLLNLTTIQGSKIYRITNRIRKSAFGTPIFVSNKKAIGIAYSDVISYEMQSLAIPAFLISKMLKEKYSEPRTLESLRSGANEQIAAENRKIKGLVLETDRGDITIRLFNETPQYRDNFIKLARENFYDSLLIHRVIKNFGIQTGAADTRYAEKDDIVGYRGPGYTIPSHIVSGLFHKRGMIGSPRKPDTKNRRRRSDGSQFYIVSGRKYFDDELDELEKENDYTFSPEQRRAYKTVGGAPHLDGTYTIFGEVVSGMDVVDAIEQVETDREWRPVEDIRLKNIRILK